LGRLRRILDPSGSETVIRGSLRRRRRVGRATPRFTASGTKSLRRLPHLREPVGLEPSRSGADSDLEAFSRNPADGSLASPSVRTNAAPNVRIDGSSRTESNYRREGLVFRTHFNGRVKLTCLTTV